MHRVLHAPSTTCTEYCIIPRSTVSRSQPVSSLISQLSADLIVYNSLHSHDYEITNELSLSCCRASLSIHRLQIDHLQVHLQFRSIAAPKCISESTRSRPPCVSPNSLDRLQVHLQTRSITASKVARWWPPSASPNSLDHGLQVHLQTRSIMASKCISGFTRSRPPSASLSSHDNGFQVHFWVHSISGSKCISKLAQSRPLSASLSSHNHGLQGYL